MKDDNLAQKEKNENSYQDASNKIMSSPKLEQRDIYFNLLSPEKTMNQKFFPTKENYLHQFFLQKVPFFLVKSSSHLHYY